MQTVQSLNMLSRMTEATMITKAACYLMAIVAVIAFSHVIEREDHPFSVTYQIK